ncbi:uncharacterized protein TNCV_4878021 [Trichonephila clavipes]|nr:uncharacterized protein TNCV_4878021 [Trichonephila clavipes]
MMNSDLADQLTKNITNCICFSLQLNESVDVIDISQPCIFVRVVFQYMRIKEELLTILPLKKKTRGEDVCCAFKKYIEEKNIPIYEVVSMTTDGAPSMTGTPVLQNSEYASSYGNLDENRELNSRKKSLEKNV